MNARSRRPAGNGLELLDSFYDDLDRYTETEMFAIINDLPVDDAWVKDSFGTYASLSAIFDWPEYSDSDTDDEELDLQDRHPLLAKLTKSSNEKMLRMFDKDICFRERCVRKRAINPRTQQLQQFCSLR